MARKGRIDVEGAVHHITQRGIDRGRIFWDDADYRSFLKRLTKNLVETRTSCYAWTLMPNHIHLVLSTGSKPIRHVLQCVFTGHAVFINRKYGRSGHLFQGRYHSILCEEETYLLRLVRYVHLNPVKTRLVGSLEELANYKWTGHRTMMGFNVFPWQRTNEVLKRFGSRIVPARVNYLGFLKEGLDYPDDEMENLGKNLKRLPTGGWESEHENGSA